MSMGVVDSSEFDDELVKLGITVPINIPAKGTTEEPEESDTAEIIDIERGRGKGNNQVPDSLRSLIGETAITEGRASALRVAETFGISDSSVSAYSKGATSTASYNEPSEELKAHLDKKKLQIQNKATKKLFRALANITEDKLDTAKAKDLSAVAKDMSVIIRNMEPEIVVNQGIKNNFILYAPMQAKEDTFEVIQVNE